MHKIQPYCDDYVFPTSRMAAPSNMVHSDWEKIHADFESHPAIIRRNGVTFWVCCVCVALFVANAVASGFNAPAFAVSCVVAVCGYLLRPAQRGTQQNYETPDKWPATRSATRSESITVIIINNVKIK